MVAILTLNWNWDLNVNSDILSHNYEFKSNYDKSWNYDKINKIMLTFLNKKGKKDLKFIFKDSKDSKDFLTQRLKIKFFIFLNFIIMT